jgi:hypothetical protein
MGLFELCFGIKLFPFVETISNNEASVAACPSIPKCRLGRKFLCARVEGRILKLVVFGPVGNEAHFIIFGMRSPFTDRMATSIGAVGGLFQSGSKFGANFNRIFISE